jgi:hypothetical protein
MIMGLFDKLFGKNIATLGAFIENRSVAGVLPGEFF